MAKEYRIHIRGKQREEIDTDLMIQLVVMFGRQLAGEAAERDEQTEQRPVEARAEPAEVAGTRE